MGSYIEPADLETALGRARYVALFDDDNDGVAEHAAVAQVILRAEARLNRYMALGYDGEFPIPPNEVPDEVKAFALDYAVLLAEARGNFIERPTIESRLEALDTDAKDMAKGVSRLTATQPSANASLPDVVAAPPGALGAGHVAFGCESVCVGNDWYRKEGC